MDLSEFFSVVMEIFGILLCFLSESLNNLRWWLFPHYKDLKNDVILITGAGGGLGRLMCMEFARHCPKIVALDYQEKGLEETAQIFHEEFGIRLHTYVCDLRSHKQIVETSQKILRDIGRVTVLINNAGIVSAKRLLDLKVEEIEDTFKVNVLAHFHTIQAFLPHMLTAGHLELSGPRGDEDPTSSSDLTVPRGHVVNITSVAGLIPGAGLSDYCASKAASLLMSECLELELSQMDLDNSIVITNVMPFLMNTEMFKGSKPLRQWLFPVVDAHFCARRVVQAVRTNERTVYVTARYRLLPIIKCFCPLETLKCLYCFGGSDKYAEQTLEERKNRKTHAE